MEIRPAGPEHYEDYCRLIHEFDLYFSKKDPAFFRAPVEPVRTREFYQSLFGADNGVLMAFVEGKASGLLNYRVDAPENYPSLLPRKILFVTILTVEQGRRRQGIGKALMAEARRVGMELKCTAVELCVQDYNQAAMEFYGAEGYRCRERILTLDLG